MFSQSLLHTYQRYRTLQTHQIKVLPLVILMPHSACNCRCIMCDIWKGNQNGKQLTAIDIENLLSTLRSMQTQQVLMTGGEALLNPLFFDFCRILKKEKIRICLLSTGLTLKHHAGNIVQWIDEIIVSLDGDRTLHDRIRNLPGAFDKLKEGVGAIRSLQPKFRITGRSVIHRINFRKWPAIIDTALELGLDQISFLPADVSSNAFNRETAWDADRQASVMLAATELPEIRQVTQSLLEAYGDRFHSLFIAESPEKIKKIGAYYAALHGLEPFPYKKCNAPWVSVVVEADGMVRPCFFHKAIGNIRNAPLAEILNSDQAFSFRKNLDMDKDETCRKCVCYLNLAPGSSLN